MVTTKLRQQVLENLKDLIWSVITFGVSVYAGVQISLNGMEKQFEIEKGLKGEIRKFLYWLEDIGYGELIVGIMLLIALISMFLIIHHLGRLTPKRSVLGCSILAQAAPHEVFHDVLRAIDTDFAMESHEFGAELIIGNQWMLSEKEVMRIGKIERIYIGKKKIEKKNKNILLAADGEGNTIEISFYQNKNRDEAVEYLRGKIPELYVGNLTELE